jgi:hypothetical protein
MFRFDNGKVSGTRVLVKNLNTDIEYLREMGTGYDHLRIILKSVFLPIFTHGESEEIKRRN